jgi:excisionase family DNA binding protein
MAPFGASNNPDREMESAAETGRRLLSIGEAAAYLGVSAASLRKWSDQGLIRVYRTPGGQRRYATADLEEFMRSMIKPTGTAKSAKTPRP